MSDDVKSLGCAVHTVGNARVSITHWSDGSKRITHSRRQKSRRGKLIFEVVEVVDVPPAFVDFVRSCMDASRSTTRRSPCRQLHAPSS